MTKKEVPCAICGQEVSFKYKPMPEWNVSGIICGKCYSEKLVEHYIAQDRRDITKK